MRLKLLLPLVIAALLEQACLELPEVETPNQTGNDTDAGMTPQKPELTETRQTATSVPGGGRVTLHIAAQDPQNSALHFSWETSAGVLTAQTSTNTLSEARWTAPACGSSPSVATATITATVTNALGLSISKTFSVTGTCYSPEIAGTQQSAPSVSDGETVTLHLTASDPQSSALSFSWRSNAGSLSTPMNTATTSEVHWAAPACNSSSAREMTATITAVTTNALGLSTPANFEVTATCPQWFAASAMLSPRAAHTATLLPSGKVFTTGGAINTATTEMYDPAIDTWSSTSSMASARSFHTATLLASGKVLIVGGTSDGSTFLQTAEVYNPTTNTWSSTGNLASARYRHTATLLPSGKVLVAGGYRGTGEPAATEIYDPTTGTWTFAGNMTAVRTGHTATLLPSGEVLIAGYGSADVYNPTTGAWKATRTRMVSDRSGHTATLLPSGKVLVVGGVLSGTYFATAEVYNPDTGAWTSTSNMPTARADHTATLLPSGKVLITGGGTRNTILASAEVYDPHSSTWSPTASMLTTRGAHAATLLPSSGNVLVTGGGNNPRAEVYAP